MPPQLHLIALLRFSADSFQHVTDNVDRIFQRLSIAAANIERTFWVWSDLGLFA